MQKLGYLWFHNVKYGVNCIRVNPIRVNPNY